MLKKGEANWAQITRTAKQQATEIRLNIENQQEPTAASLD
jgi:hypothetical protein